MGPLGILLPHAGSSCSPKPSHQEVALGPSLAAVWISSCLTAAVSHEEIQRAASQDPRAISWWLGIGQQEEQAGGSRMPNGPI